MFAVAIDYCQSVFDIVVPVRCALCGRHSTHVCQECCDRLQSTRLTTRAARAGCPQVVALGAYAGSLRSAVLAVKFRQRRAAASRLGALLGAKLNSEIDAIVPIPLHYERQLARGFNQAEVIAQGAASTLGAPLFRHALIRARSTIAQSSLALRERTRNVRGAFALGSEAGLLRGARVIIVDDVVTTGATAAACAAVLMEGNVATVMVATIAIRL